MTALLEQWVARRDAPSRARWLIVFVALVFLVASPIYTMVGYRYGNRTVGAPIVVVPLAVVIGAIHLRHSLAAASGHLPAGWTWTFLALIALVYVPMIWWTWNWVSMQPFVIASALLLLPGRVGALVASLPIAGTAIRSAIQGYSLAAPSPTVAQRAYLVTYWVSALVLAGAVLYGVVRLARIAEQISASRAELAESAMVHERLRISRDLHDLLGQSLSAVSLKGDLALALLRSDPPAARAEVEGLTDVARGALRDIRAITRDEHVTTLRAEFDGAVALLSAAGIEVHVVMSVSTITPAVEQLLGWTVREGVTNVLRHSEARTCSITADSRDGLLRLEIVNDRPHAATGDGTGLAGLSGRAQELAGVLSVSRTGDSFRLLVEIPEATR